MSDEQELVQDEEQPVAEVPEQEPEQRSEAAPDDGTEQAEQHEDERPKPRRSAAKRIGQLTAEKRAAEREIEQLRAQLEQRHFHAEPDAADEAPKADDFDDYEKYLEAKAEHKAAQVAERKLQSLREEQQQSERARLEEQQVAAYNEARETLIEAGESKYEDFAEIALNEELPVAAPMAEAMLSMGEEGADVWYHLAKNPKVAEKISGMEPIRQLIEIGGIAKDLASQSKQASSAPKPTTSVNTRGSSSNQLRDNISADEWIKRRNAEIRKNSA